MSISRLWSLVPPTRVQLSTHGTPGHVHVQSRTVESADITSDLLTINHANYHTRWKQTFHSKSLKLWFMTPKLTVTEIMLSIISWPFGHSGLHPRRSGTCGNTTNPISLSLKLEQHQILTSRTQRRLMSVSHRMTVMRISCGFSKTRSP